MTMVYNAQAFKDGKHISEDFEQEPKAKAFVEQLGEGRVVTFLKAQGKFDHDRSCSMECYDGTTWQAFDIHR